MSDVVDSISKDDFVELFTIQVRGTVATAFACSAKVICEDHWNMLRGNKEFTMRDMGEIGAITGFNMNIQLMPATKGTTK